MTVVTFREKMSAECHRIYEYGVERYEERQAELRQVHDCIDEAIASSREHGTTLINDFTAYKTEVGPTDRSTRLCPVSTASICC